MEILGLIDIPVWLALTLFSLLLGYIYATWTYDTFKKLGIPGPRPLPLIGTTYLMFLGYPDVRIFDREIMRKYGKFVGVYEGRQPVLLISDPEAIKQIMVKDFQSFINRPDLIDIDAMDKPTDQMLSVIKDDEWVQMRKLLSPTFTTGKLKKMMKHLNKNADSLRDALEAKAKANEHVEIKAFMGAFTMDAIASSAFGIELDSQKDPNSSFIVHAKGFFGQSTLLFVSLFVFPFLQPILKKVFGMSFFPKSSVDFFMNVVKKAIQQRKEQNMEQSDFLQLLMNAHETLPNEEDKKDKEIMSDVLEDKFGQKKRSKGLTEDEIMAQSVLFIFAGYETTAQTLMFLAYLLALNPDKQDKLIEEVDMVTEGNPITHEMIGQLTYMEQAINETLRMKSIAVRVFRVASETVTVAGIHIPKGMRVDIPLEAIHYDPEVYPEPEKFMPERFSPEEKAGRSQYSWMPFGVGPRNCIGMRLAILEVKLAMARILQKLKFVKCDKTEVPLVFKNGQVKNPIKLGMQLR